MPILLLLVLLLGGCSTKGVPAPIIDRAILSKSQSHHRVHSVRTGETLYSIAWGYGLDYRELARLNQLDPSYKIHRGQKLTLRGSNSPHITPSVQKIRWQAAKPIKTLVQKEIPTQKETYVARVNTPIHWTWPVHGRIVNYFSPHGMNRGIDIVARLKTPIVAAAKGKVVYSGNGLRGYGAMIIIKHSDEYLSAYAHNRVLYVKEGMLVRTGQKIAEIGNSDSKRVMLHFEIRRAGKPVNPLLFLSERGNV